MTVRIAAVVLFSIGLGYSALFKGGVWPNDWHITLVLIGAGSLSYWIPKSSSQKIPRVGIFARWPLLLLPVYVLLQLVPLPQRILAVVSPQRAEQLEGLRRIVPVGLAPLSVFPPATVEYFFRLLACFAVLLTMREITWFSSAKRWAVVSPLIILGSMEAALGMFQVADAWPNGRAVGTYVNRDHFAGLLEMCLPLAIMYSIAIWRRTDRHKRSPAGPAFAAAGLAAIAGLILLGIIYSLSRMGFLVALSSLFLVAGMSIGPRLPSWRWRWLSLGVLGAAVIVLFILLPPDQLIARFADLASSDKISADDRLHMWKESLVLIRSYLWFGCGLGGFESAFGRFQISMPTFSVDFAHNDYLQVAAELGLIGTVLVIALVVAVLSKAFRAALQEDTVDGRCLAIGCLGSLTAMMLHSLVDFNLQVPANALVMAWIAGVTLGLRDRLTKRGTA